MGGSDGRVAEGTQVAIAHVIHEKEHEIGAPGLVLPTGVYHPRYRTGCNTGTQDPNKLTTIHFACHLQVPFITTEPVFIRTPSIYSRTFGIKLADEPFVDDFINGGRHNSEEPCQVNYGAACSYLVHVQGGLL